MKDEETVGVEEVRQEGEVVEPPEGEAGHAPGQTAEESTDVVEIDTETSDAPAESSAAQLDDALAAVERFDSRLEESQRLLARQTDLVDRLHAENGELRAGELRTAQLPLVRDLLRLHDDVGRMRDAAGEDDHDLRIVQESLLDTLNHNGIAAFAPEPGEPFDSRIHTATGVEPTEEEALDKAVAEVVKHGFQWEAGDTIRVAEVRAYRYRGSP